MVLVLALAWYYLRSSSCVVMLLVLIEFVSKPARHQECHQRLMTSVTAGDANDARDKLPDKKKGGIL